MTAAILDIGGLEPAGLPGAGSGAVFAFWAIFLIWVGGEVWLQQHRRLPPSATNQDIGSMRLLIASVWTSVGIGLASSYVLTELSIGNGNESLLEVGLALMVIGLALRWWAVAVLGSAFTVTVGVQSQQRLVAAGPYRWVRHPSYSGSLLTLVGVALVCANWLALAALLLPLGAYSYRIYVEEIALSARFGDAYRDYHQSTRRLVPWLF